MITIGADPEFFLERDGVPVSAYDMIPGTKHKPHPVECGAVQVDGMALEFNIDPAIESQEFVHNINTVLGHLRDMIPPEYDFSYTSVAAFGRDYIKAQPQKARILGCTPDFNAYTGRQNKNPSILNPIRTAAGHIHIGWLSENDIAFNARHLAECRVFTKQLDYVLGLPSLLVDTDPTRRQMYGKAGAYRPKPYGVEYRVLSNFWLQSDTLKAWVFNSTQQAWTWLTEEGMNFYERYGNTAQKLINTNSRLIGSFIDRDNGLHSIVSNLMETANEKI